MLNLVYSAYLKRVVIVDLMVIASGFLLRAVAGGFVIVTASTVVAYYFYTLSPEFQAKLGMRSYL